MASERDQTSKDVVEVSADNIQEAAPGEGDGEEAKKLSFAERAEGLKQLARGPFNCPISGCKRVLSANELLAHAVCDHVKDCQFHKAHAGMPISLECKISDFKSGEAKCLGVIGYTGIPESSMDNIDQQPGGRLICLPNEGLHGPSEALSFLLPVCVMGCKTTLAGALLPEVQLQFTSAKASGNQVVMIFWLLGAPALKTIHAAVSAVDLKRDLTVSSFLEIRDCASPTGLKDIAAKDNQNLIFRLDRNTDEGEQKALIEVVIHEFDKKYKD